MEEIKIGKQVWMSENLNVETFRNGDPILHAKTAEEWEKAGKNKQPAWCYYDNRSVQNDPENGENYGKLYNWYAVADSRGLAPKGWHIPTDDEWTVLTNFLGGEQGAGAMLKSKTGWSNNGNGTNSSGFNGLPAGYRFYDGSFGYFGEYGYWWSSTEYDSNHPWFRFLYYLYDNASRDSFMKEFGYSVRCLRD
jgi:uncharacterized protein (TIGR02145 family)